MTGLVSQAPSSIAGEYLADYLFYFVLLDESRHGDASALLARIVAGSPPDPVLLNLQAEAILERLRPGETGAEFERAGLLTRAAIKGDPDGVRSLFNRARWLAARGDKDAALGVLMAAARRPDASRQVFSLALEMAGGRDARGCLLWLLETARDRGLADSEMLYKLGMRYVALGRLVDAVATLEAVRREDDGEDALRATNALIVLYRELLDFQAARECVRRMQDRFPRDPVYFGHAVLLDFLAGKAVAPSRAEILKISGLLETTRHVAQRAALCLVIGRTDMAARLVADESRATGYIADRVRFSLARSASAGAERALVLAETASEMRQHALAGHWLDKAFALDARGMQKNATYHGMRARCALFRGDAPAAEMSARAFLRLDAGNPVAANLLGTALVRQGRHDQALAIFVKHDDRTALLASMVMLARDDRAVEALRYGTELLRLEPENDIGVSFVARLLTVSGRTNEARVLLEAWHARGGDDPEMLLQLALLLGDQPVRVLSLVDAGLVLAPESVGLLGLRGQVLLQSGRFGEAVAVLEKALGLARGRSERAELLLNLGDCHIRMNRKRSALAAWRQAAMLQPDMPGVRSRLDEHENLERGKSR